jgi:hypothetical protein
MSNNLIKNFQELQKNYIDNFNARKEALAQAQAALQKNKQRKNNVNHMLAQKDYNRLTQEYEFANFIYSLPKPSSKTPILNELAKMTQRSAAAATAQDLHDLFEDKDMIDPSYLRPKFRKSKKSGRRSLRLKQTCC